jgi:hypothetical protein
MSSGVFHEAPLLFTTTVPGGGGGGGGGGGAEPNEMSATIPKSTWLKLQVNATFLKNFDIYFSFDVIVLSGVLMFTFFLIVKRK